MSIGGGDRALCSGQLFPLFFLLEKTLTCDRHWLPPLFPSDHRWILFKRRWLPFKCRPIVCQNYELVTGRPGFSWFTLINFGGREGGSVGAMKFPHEFLRKGNLRTGDGS